jgi:hypothetical protein
MIDDSIELSPSSSPKERINRIRRLIFSLLEGADNMWEVMNSLQSGLEFAFASLTLRQRLQNMGPEILLATIYTVLLGWFSVEHISSLAGLWHLAALIVPDAFAEEKSFQSPVSIKIAILTGYSIALIVVLIMSAYASMLRKPPLQSAKDILKLILGFITGQLTLAGFLT